MFSRMGGEYGPCVFNRMIQVIRQDSAVFEGFNRKSYKLFSANYVLLPFVFRKDLQNVFQNCVESKISLEINTNLLEC